MVVQHINRFVLSYMPEEEVMTSPLLPANGAVPDNQRGGGGGSEGTPDWGGVIDDERVSG